MLLLAPQPPQGLLPLNGQQPVPHDDEMPQHACAVPEERGRRRHPVTLEAVYGFWKMAMDSTVVKTPLALPSTCSVSALVYRVTCATSFHPRFAVMNDYPSG